MASRLKITLKKSSIGFERSQGATVRNLGLRKINQSVVQDDNAVIRGMIHKVRHMVEVTPITEE